LTKSRSQINLEVINIADLIAYHDGLAVGRQRNRQGRTVQRYFGTAGPLLDIPKPECAVVRARYCVATVGAECNRAHRSVMLSKRVQELTGSQVPEPKRPIPGSGKRLAVVGRKGNRVNCILMSDERMDEIAGLQIPELESPVDRTR
jgi:hypothetical protein